ncbi:hypothetical protein VCRA2119O147_2170004 [Vibrio crassostreae]|nr:hypothetical protein VCRA2116O233_150109 [Vibrio crassostreae]CAK1802200.1 hypothetical protein VCRA2113O119_160124 [Vibrio crassostreae]CAK1817658.1 hypothetical protein VCRA2113O221_180100 [Vibrio crassostreae]CAK1817822.1 hypothetical protein VCRA2111O320_180107 [Vibrio crassostreae]CAK1822257.1 hypothetical protein VCRA2113O197_190103 [Vibrio crassostreae]
MLTMPPFPYPKNFHSISTSKNERLLCLPYQKPPHSQQDQNSALKT